MYYKKNLLFLGFVLLNTLLVADSTLKHTIKSNGQAVYGEMQKSVDSFKGMFKEGDFYGRIRNNNFYFAYNHPDTGHEDNVVSAIGTSLIYKSASFEGFDFALGLYVSRAFLVIVNWTKFRTSNHLKILLADTNMPMVVQNFFMF